MSVATRATSFVDLYEDGRPGELFVEIAKQGSTMRGLADAIEILRRLEAPICATRFCTRRRSGRARSLSPRFLARTANHFLPLHCHSSLSHLDCILFFLHTYSYPGRLIAEWSTARTRHSERVILSIDRLFSSGALKLCGDGGLQSISSAVPRFTRAPSKP